MSVIPYFKKDEEHGWKRWMVPKAVFMPSVMKATHLIYANVETDAWCEWYNRNQRTPSERQSEYQH